MIPGHYYGSFMKVNGGKTILSFNESGTFFWKYDTYRMCVENNTLIPLFHKRNYSFVAMSPDNQFIIMRNDANHWGFYSRENTLEILIPKVLWYILSVKALTIQPGQKIHQTLRIFMPQSMTTELAALNGGN